MESISNQPYPKSNDNNIFLILIILIVAILWFTGFLNSRKEGMVLKSTNPKKPGNRRSDRRSDGPQNLNFLWNDDPQNLNPLMNTNKNNEDKLCCGGRGGKRSSLLCEPNAFVTQFTGKAGDMIDNIGIECSDGSSVNAVGGSGGNIFNTHSPTGFSKLVVGADSYVNNIRFFNDNDQEVGQSVGGGIGNQYTLNCDKGRIRGLDVNSGYLIDRIQVVCDESTP